MDKSTSSEAGDIHTGVPLPSLPILKENSIVLPELHVALEKNSSSPSRPQGQKPPSFIPIRKARKFPRPLFSLVQPCIHIGNCAHNASSPLPALCVKGGLAVGGSFRVCPLQDSRSLVK
ncbi:unnamed protein product [Ectocarpus sp. 12 AP-2014]